VIDGLAGGGSRHFAEMHGIVAVLVVVVVVGAVTVVVVVAAAVFSILMSVMTLAAIDACCADADWLPPAKTNKRLAKIPIFWGRDSNFIVSPMWPGDDGG